MHGGRSSDTSVNELLKEGHAVLRTTSPIQNYHLNHIS